MSSNDEFRGGQTGLDSGDHQVRSPFIIMVKEYRTNRAFHRIQTAYIFAPADIVEDSTARPAKKRKIGQNTSVISTHTSKSPPFGFELLLNGTESFEAASLRQELFKKYWSKTDLQVQVRMVVSQTQGTR